MRRWTDTQTDEVRINSDRKTVMQTETLRQTKKRQPDLKWEPAERERERQKERYARLQPQNVKAFTLTSRLKHGQRLKGGQSI